jgi:isorenieratene synthase
MLLRDRFVAALRRLDVRRSITNGIRFGRRLPAEPLHDLRPDHEQAEPGWIRRALAASQARSGGGWFVLDASRRCGEQPRSFWVGGRALVVFRSGSQLVAARDVCPHMGAALSGGFVRAGQLHCPWHGLRFGPEPCGGYRPLPTHEDGRLAWVRIDDAGESPTDKPVLAERPERGIEGVIRVEARCDPADVIANRLDPWHGAHYHPHSFAWLRILERGSDDVTVRVAYRVVWPWVMEVDARFHCPDARTVVMTIVRGEGAGSVVETHATPLRADRTAITELTVANSQRIGFAAARSLQPLLRPFVEHAARRLWVDDAAYAERLYALRHGEVREPTRLAPASMHASAPSINVEPSTRARDSKA